MRCRDTKDVTLKSQYKRYCKILTDVIKLAKKMHYNEIICKSKNKIKSTWNVIKNELGKGNRHNNIKSLEINNTVTNDPQEIANIFSDYFLSAADTVIKNIKKGNADQNDKKDAIEYLTNNISTNFSEIHWQYATISEIDKIIKSLKTKN